MKSFFSIFRESARELKKTTTLTVCGLLIALSIILRAFSVPLTIDVRITFSYIPIAVIAMLFGPVSAVIANTATDFIGFLVDNKSARGYNPYLLIPVILAALIYGLFLYRKRLNLIMVTLSRIAVVLISNITLKSYILYISYYNKNFNPFTPDTAFISWFSLRVAKNAIQLPIDLALLCILLPIIRLSYERVFGRGIRRMHQGV
ncbi:MAG: folate family ECF transporter S component [Oscillospiraceae bacterium]|jgi:ECF transporter S component (folate family)